MSTIHPTSAADAQRLLEQGPDDTGQIAPNPYRQHVYRGPLDPPPSPYIGEIVHFLDTQNQIRAALITGLYDNSDEVDLCAWLLGSAGTQAAIRVPPDAHDGCVYRWRPIQGGG